MSLNKITQVSNKQLQFWAPLFTDSTGTLFSPGYTFYPERLNIWDYVFFTINGTKVQTPGVAEVRFARAKNKDKKKSVGQDETTTTTSGIKAAEIVIELMVNTPQHKQWIDTYGQILFPKPGKDGGKQPTFQVSHPLFRSFGVKSMIITGIEGPLRHTVPGTKLYKITGTEYFPQTSKPAGGTGQPPPSLAKQTSDAALGPGQSMANQTSANATQSFQP